MLQWNHETGQAFSAPSMDTGLFFMTRSGIRTCTLNLYILIIRKENEYESNRSPVLESRSAGIKEKTTAFYAGDLDKMAYKGFSGLYGSYAQKGGKASMLRLRMTAGRVTREKLAFVAEAVRTHKVSRIHFTTCQTIQLHDLQQEAVFDIMERALDCGIVTMGGGGDFPRNVMCSPLSGVEKDEYFNVMPYAEAAADYLMNFIKAEKCPGN